MTLATLSRPILALAALAAAPLAANASAAGTPQAQALDAAFLADAPPAPQPVAVCVIDTGVDLTADTAPVVVERMNASGLPALGDAHPNGHGTHVAAMIAGSYGVWPQARIVSVRAWAPDSAEPFWTLYGQAVYACLSSSQPVRVINISIADPTAEPGSVAPLRDAVRDALSRGVSVTVSAGNDAAQSLGAPADIPGVIPVAAANQAGGLCPYSSHVPAILAAPACPRVETTGLDGQPILLDGGTSLAAPQVAAVLAALRAYQPGLSRAGAESAVADSAVATAAGARVVDARAAFGRAGLANLAKTAVLPNSGPPRPAVIPAAVRQPLPSPLRLAQPAIAAMVRTPTAIRIDLLGLPAGVRVQLFGRARMRRRLSVIAPRSASRRTISLRAVAPGYLPSPRVRIAIPAVSAQVPR